MKSTCATKVGTRREAAEMYYVFSLRVSLPWSGPVGERHVTILPYANCIKIGLQDTFDIWSPNTDSAGPPIGACLHAYSDSLGLHDG